MDCDPPPRCGPPAPYDARRAREFNKYFEPFRHLVNGTPVWTNLHSDDAVAAHQPVASPDKALTAFCQLAAHKMNVSRAMIFLFDSDYGYVIAEATKSLSLRNHQKFEGDDGLWLGYAKIPRGYSVCEHTVNIPSAAENARNDVFSETAHIINDLTGDLRFCNRPFVTGGPRLRYYCGVPITTSAGLNIGALCALDDVPHNETSTEQLELLTDLAAAVSCHLEAMKDQAEARKGNAMLRSLTQFMHHTNLARNECETDDLPSPTAPARIVPTSDGADISKTDTDAQLHRANADPLSAETRDPCPESDVATHPQHPTLSASDVSTVDTNIATSHEARSSEGESCGIIEGTHDLKIGDSTQDTKTTNLPKTPTRNLFGSAAEALQETLHVDGIIFLDASAEGFGNTLSPRGSQVACPTSSEPTSADGENRPAAHSPESLLAEDSLCHILANACSTTATRHSTGISHRLLKTLIRKYQNGKIWHVLGEDDSSNYDSAATASPHELSTERTNESGNNPDHFTALNLAIPDAQSMMFLPVWNHGSGRWCLGAIAYTKSPTRMFSADFDLAFMRAFCDVLVVELDHLETRSILKAKSTFVSSITHELRTPLHGILGTVDHLKDQALDYATNRMIAQIETCGQTMLDTMNHLLDFSSVEHIVQQRHSSASDGSIISKLSARAVGSPRRFGTLTRPKSKSSLDQLTEDVIDSIIYSFSNRGSKNHSRIQRVTTILNVIKGNGSDWTCRVNAGAWKRVCTNVVINALKFTEDGYINVTVQQEPPKHNNDVATAILTVTDTGCGMSTHFMSSALFTPFEQEDGMSDGTGIGLSLVVKILKALGGHISVESTRGVGTTVTVSMPLTQTRTQIRRQVSDREAAQLLATENPIVPIFVGRSWTENKETPYGAGRRILQQSIEAGLTQISVEVAHKTGRIPNLRVHIISEADLIDLLTNKHSEDSLHIIPSYEPLDGPLLVVCKSLHGMRLCRDAIMNTKLSKLPEEQIDFIAEPCGRIQLSKVVSAFLRETSPTMSLPLGQSRDANPKMHNTQSTPGLGSTSCESCPSTPFTPAPRMYYGAADAQKSRRAEADYFSWKIAASTVAELPLLSPGTSAGMSEDLVRLPTPQDLHDASADPLSMRKIDTAMLLVDDNHVNMRLLTMYADRQRYRKLTAVNGSIAVEMYRKALMLDVAAAEMDMKPSLTPRPGTATQNELIGDDSPASSVSPEQSGNSAAQATEGAVSLLENPVLLDRPLIILMDVSMPVMDGFTATRQIRALEAQVASRAAFFGKRPPRAFIVALTGLGSQSARDEAMASGMDMFMTKPVRTKELTRELEARGWK